jgi:anti-sigma B factor antagonist
VERVDVRWTYMPQAGFTTREDDREAVLVVAGEIDLATCTDFRREIRALVQSAGDRSIVLDLAAVTFLDSSGLEVLVTQQAALAPRLLTLRHVSKSVRRVLQVTATIHRFGWER